MFDILSSWLDTRNGTTEAPADYTPPERERNVPTRILIAERTGRHQPYCRTEQQDESSARSWLQVWRSLLTSASDRLLPGNSPQDSP